MAATVKMLEARAAVLRASRRVFEEQAFVEVETPMRVINPGQEVHLDAFASPGPDGVRHLVTSPEYAMKRLLAAGMPRIHQIARCFRRGERGPHHLPEFTMVEWYRARAPLDAVAQDCEALLDAARKAALALGLPAPQVVLPFERATVADLVRRHAGVAIEGDESGPQLQRKARAAGLAVGASDAYDDVFFQIWLDRVEPRLGGAAQAPVFVFDWPAPLAALARRRPGAPAWAERFELYAGGLELANAFAELADPAEQRTRFLGEQARRVAAGKDVYPLDERLLAALPGIDGAAGCALGFDRLVMWATGARDIAEVTAFADER